MQTRLTDLATSCSSTEKHLSKHLGGYQARSKALRQRMVDMSETLEKTRIDLDTKRNVLVGEDAAMSGRLEKLREEVEAVMRRERFAQDVYRENRQELAGLKDGVTNGV